MGASPSRLIIPKLPLELHQAIIDEVDSQSDLLTLLRVSRYFNSAAERRLYNTISLSGPAPPSKAARKKKLSVFRRIITCPRVAAYVFHLTFKIESWSLPASYNLSYFVKLFLSVPNLKSLCIHPSHPIVHSLQPPVPFLLRTFEYDCWDSSVAPVVEAFLETQVRLEELLLSRSPDFGLTLTPSALPKLTTFSGPAKFVHMLLPGRPVKRLKMFRESEAYTINASPIRSLYVHLYADLNWYISLSPTLTFLACAVLGYKDKRLLQYVGCCPRLEKLAVFIDGVHAVRFWPVEEKLAFVNSSFASCPSLCCIELLDSDYAVQEGDHSMTWMRGSQTGTPSLWDWEEWRER